MAKLKYFVSIALLLILLAGCSSMNSDSVIRMGTGGVGGNYYQYGNLLAGLVQEDMKNVTLDVQTTEGSSSNLRLIGKGFLDMAIVQNDALYDAVQGKRDFDGNPVDNVQAIAALYTETLQIVVRKDSDIHQVSDLKGHSVSLGEKKSGVLRNAEDVLHAAGISTNQVEVQNLSFSDSAKELAAGKIDAFFVMAGAPTTAISELTKDTDVRLLSMDDTTRNVLLRLHSEYQKADIPANTYSGQTEHISTISVKAVLVCDSRMSEDTISGITEALFQHSDEIQYGTSEQSAPTLKYATSDISTDFHAGAAAYYKSKNLDVTGGSRSTQKKSVRASQDSE